VNDMPAMVLLEQQRNCKRRNHDRSLHLPVPTVAAGAGTDSSGHCRARAAPGPPAPSPDSRNPPMDAPQSPDTAPTRARTTRRGR
jgi:hypothetical protein